MIEDVLYERAIANVKDLGCSIKYKKDSKFWRFWAKVKRSPNNGITTTWRKTIWLPDDWDETVSTKEKAFILIHEIVHLYQFKKLTWFLFLLGYLFPVPLFLCWGRYYLERKAYEEEFKLRMQFYQDDYIYLADSFARDISRSVYFAWPYSLAYKDMKKRLFKYV